MKPSFKATVYVSGSHPQHLYGANRDKLRARAIAALTSHKPGVGNLWPQRVVVQEHTGVLSGNRSTWSIVDTIPYDEVPLEKHGWRIREAERAAQPKPPPPPPPPPLSAFVVICRLILNRITDKTWQAVYAVVPENNRCFNADYLDKVVGSRDADMAWELLDSDFGRLSAAWQMNLTGRSWKEWLDYEREERRKEVKSNV